MILQRGFCIQNVYVNEPVQLVTVGSNKFEPVTARLESVNSTKNDRQTDKEQVKIHISREYSPLIIICECLSWTCHCTFNELVTVRASSASKRRWINAGLMLVHRLRWWNNIKVALGQRLVFVGSDCYTFNTRRRWPSINSTLAQCRVSGVVPRFQVRVTVNDSTLFLGPSIAFYIWLSDCDNLSHDGIN